MQKFLTLAIAAIIIYIVIDAKQSLMPEQAAPTTPPEPYSTDLLDPNTPRPEIEGGMVEKSISKVLINVLKSPEGRSFLEKVVRPADRPITGDYSQKVNNDSIIKELFRIEVMQPGTGPKVSCGNTVTVKYEVLNMQRVIMESGAKTFILGSNDIIPGLSNMVVGMQKGEVRKAMIPKAFAYDATNFSGKKPEFSSDYYQITATLVDAASNSFIDGNNVKIFDDEIAYTVPYLCGDRASFDAKIIRTNGEVIYNSNNKIMMNIGDNSYPMIFAHALFNKTPFGTRTVICRGEYLESLDANGKNKIFPKSNIKPNKNEFFLIEFSNFNREVK